MDRNSVSFSVVVKSLTAFTTFILYTAANDQWCGVTRYIARDLASLTTLVEKCGENP